MAIFGMKCLFMKQSPLKIACVILFTFIMIFHLSLKKTFNYDNFKIKKFPNIYKTSSKYLQSIFEQEDMIDEYGNSFSIVIWSSDENSFDYKANSSECLANIECEIRTSFFNITTAHAIIFEASAISSPRLPLQRYPHQLYVWWASDSPAYSHKPPEHMDSSFNLTFHYRTDADIYAPYGSIHLILRELKDADETDLESLLRKKRESKKIAAWDVNNCSPIRLKFAKSLIKLGLKVDTFGKCFFLNRQLGQKGASSTQIYDELGKYKFYFSFENSRGCKDYITEQFWFNGLRSGAVPIVWGPRKEDVLKVAPSKSFIHTDDFASPDELVKYLQYLSRNETAYAEYLQWRTWVNHPERIEEWLQDNNWDNELKSFCKLCSILQTDAKRRKLRLPQIERIHSSLTKHWFGKDKQCRV